jgi:hypothetical protein
LPARTRLIPVLLALITVVLAVGAAACGGGGGGSGADARQVVQQTFAGNKRVDSGKLDLSMTANLSATGLAATQVGNNPIIIKMAGPFQSRGTNKLPAMDLTLSASGSGADFSAGAISTGDKGYVTFQGKPYTVPDSVFARFKRGFEQQQRQSSSTQNVDFKALGINPDSWLKNPKDEGDEEIGGATTTHVSSDVDLDALLKDLDSLLKRADKLGLSQQQLQQVPRGLNSQTRKQLKDSVKKAKVDIWTGKDDKVLRRLRLDLSFVVPAALQSQLQGVKGGNVKLDLVVADVNKPQDISPPANPRPWSELQQLIPQSTLGSGLGGSSGGGSSGGSSGSTGGSGSGTSTSNRAQKYLKCVQKAQRPEDVTKCGSILGR